MLIVWTGLIWLRIGTSEGLFWTRKWTFGFHKTLLSSWVAAQEEFSSVKLDNPAEQGLFLRTRTWVRWPEFHITSRNLNFFSVVAFEALAAIIMEVIEVVTRGSSERVRNFGQMYLITSRRPKSNQARKQKSSLAWGLNPHFLPKRRTFSHLHGFGMTFRSHVHRNSSLGNFLNKVNPFHDLSP
jgi:hypothetical protein